MLKQKVSFVIRETFVDALTTAYLKVMLIADLKATRPGQKTAGQRWWWQRQRSLSLLQSHRPPLGHDMTYEQYTTIVEKFFMLLTMFNCCVLNKRR